MSLCGTDGQTTEDRATQPMEAGGWVSQLRTSALHSKKQEARKSEEAQEAREAREAWEARKAWEAREAHEGQTNILPGVISNPKNYIAFPLYWGYIIVTKRADFDVSPKNMQYDFPKIHFFW